MSRIEDLETRMKVRGEQRGSSDALMAERRGVNPAIVTLLGIMLAQKNSEKMLLGSGVSVNGQSLVPREARDFISTNSGQIIRSDVVLSAEGVGTIEVGKTERMLRPNLAGLKVALPDFSKIDFGLLEKVEHLTTERNQRAEKAETRVEGKQIKAEKIGVDKNEIGRMLSLPERSFEVQEILNGGPGALKMGVVEVTPILANEVIRNTLTKEMEEVYINKPGIERSGESLTERERQNETTSNSQRSVSRTNDRTPEQKVGSMVGTTTQSQKEVFRKNGVEWAAWTKKQFEENQRDVLAKVAIRNKKRDPLLVQIDIDQLRNRGVPEGILSTIELGFNSGYRELVRFAVPTLFDGTIAYLLEEAVEGREIDNRVGRRIGQMEEERLSKSIKLLNIVSKNAISYFANLVDLCKESARAGRVILTPSELVFMGMAVGAFYSGVDGNGKIKRQNGGLLNRLKI